MSEPVPPGGMDVLSDALAITIPFPHNSVAGVRSAERRKCPDDSPTTVPARRSDRHREQFIAQALPHLDSLYAYALRLCPNEADAQDLVQDTYLKAYRFFDSFESGTNCKGWLFRILKNGFINRYRRARRLPPIVDYDEVAEAYDGGRLSYSSTGDTPATFFDNLLDDDVTSAIASLPEEFQTVVVLCDIEEFTYEEAAAVVRCPVGTIRSRLHRGRKLLRSRLHAYASNRGYVVARNDAVGEQ